MTSIDAAHRLRLVCMAMPGAEEVAMRRGPTYRRAGKIFACERVHGDAAAVWCKTPEGGQAHLLAAEPDRFFAPPYFGPKGWIGIRLAHAPDWGEVEALVRRSYDLVGRSRTRRKTEI